MIVAQTIKLEAKAIQNCQPIFNHLRLSRSQRCSIFTETPTIPTRYLHDTLVYRTLQTTRSRIWLTMDDVKRVFTYNALRHTLYICAFISSTDITTDKTTDNEEREVVREHGAVSLLHPQV